MVAQFIEEEASVTESSPAPPEVTDDADDLVSVFYTHDHYQVYYPTCSCSWQWCDESKSDLMWTIFPLISLIPVNYLHCMLILHAFLEQSCGLKRNIVFTCILFQNNDWERKTLNEYNYVAIIIIISVVYPPPARLYQPSSSVRPNLNTSALWGERKILSIHSNI